MAAEESTDTGEPSPTDVCKWRGYQDVPDLCRSLKEIGMLVAPSVDWSFRYDDQILPYCIQISARLSFGSVEARVNVPVTIRMAIEDPKGTMVGIVHLLGKMERHRAAEIARERLAKVDTRDHAVSSVELERYLGEHDLTLAAIRFLRAMKYKTGDREAALREIEEIAKTEIRHRFPERADSMIAEIDGWWI